MSSVRPPVLLLVVEDHADSREMLREFLEHQGFAVTTAGNGVEALARLETHAPPDLILLDLTMPVMDGWTFRNVLLSDQRWSELPVVVVSALDDADPDAVQASLRKPVDLDVLLETIQRVLEKANR